MVKKVALYHWNALQMHTANGTLVREGYYAHENKPSYTHRFRTYRHGCGRVCSDRPSICCRRPKL